MTGQTTEKLNYNMYLADVSLKSTALEFVLESHSDIKFTAIIIFFQSKKDPNYNTTLSSRWQP